MSMVNEQFYFLKDLARLIEFIDSKGFLITGGELWRTPEQQEIYVKSGRSMTSNSKHLSRLAIDLNFFTEDGKIISDKKLLDPIGEYWEGLSDKNRWGGNFKTLVDLPHFERNV